MPAFTIGVAQETETSSITVEFPAGTEPLMPGTHTFKLVVYDNDGLPSAPALFDVVVKDDRAPTAVLYGPEQVLYGKEFELNGEKSSDPYPGKVVKYEWTLLS